MPLSTCEKARKLESSNSTGIARSQFHGLAGGRRVDTSDTQEPQMSDGPIARPEQPRKSSKIMALPSKSDESGVRIDCRPLTMTSFSNINGTGKSIVERNGRMWTASAGGFTALRSGWSNYEPNPELFVVIGGVHAKVALALQAQAHAGGNFENKSSGIHSLLDVSHRACGEFVSKTIWFGKGASKSCPGTSKCTPLITCVQLLPAKYGN